MIFVRHTEECTGKPNAVGRLTGKCNCKTAKLDGAARAQLQRLLGKLADASIRAGEESEYFALRLDELADQIAKDARGVRRTAKRADRTTRLTTHHKTKGAQ
jgi:hypothetical protein